MKDLKEQLINESAHKFYPEDWANMESEEDVVDAILNALEFSGIYDVMCESIEESLDPHMFTDDKFLKLFGKKLSDAVNEYYEENYE